MTSFHQVVEARSKEAEDKSITIHTDKEYNDNPMDRVDVEEKVVVNTLTDLDSVYKACIQNCNVDLQVGHNFWRCLKLWNFIVDM